VGLASTGGAVLPRVQRLLTPPTRLPVATRLGGTAVAVSLVVTPALLAFVPAAFAAWLMACPSLLG
jgi:hypothetical protein